MGNTEGLQILHTENAQPFPLHYQSIVSTAAEHHRFDTVAYLLSDEGVRAFKNQSSEEYYATLAGLARMAVLMESHSKEKCRTLLDTLLHSTPLPQWERFVVNPSILEKIQYHSARVLRDKIHNALPASNTSVKRKM